MHSGKAWIQLWINCRADWDLERKKFIKDNENTEHIDDKIVDQVCGVRSKLIKSFLIIENQCVVILSLLYRAVFDETSQDIILGWVKSFWNILVA